MFLKLIKMLTSTKLEKLKNERFAHYQSITFLDHKILALNNNLNHVKEKNNQIKGGKYYGI